MSDNLIIKSATVDSVADKQPQIGFANPSDADTATPVNDKKNVDTWTIN